MSWDKKEEDSESIKLFFIVNNFILIEHIYFKETDRHVEFIFDKDGGETKVSDDQKVLSLIFPLRLSYSKT